MDRNYLAIYEIKNNKRTLDYEISINEYQAYKIITNWRNAYKNKNCYAFEDKHINNNIINRKTLEYITTFQLSKNIMYVIRTRKTK